MFHDNPYYQLNHFSRIVGSCNGLHLVGSSFHSYYRRDHWLWFYFWNPALRTKSKKFQIFCSRSRHFNFSFGYDNSTNTYKVVGFYVERNLSSNPKSVVKVFSSKERFWRDIHCFPVHPLNCVHRYKNNGVHLNGTINWIGLRDYKINSRTTIDQYVILSLDLSTETYTQLLPPPRFDKVPRHPPKLVVLMDCLCFCHNFENTHFIIWQMKDFGVQDSWIQLFTISYHCQPFFKLWDLLPLYLSENHCTMIFANEKDKEAVIYNRRHNSAARIVISNKILWSQASDYVESLVSTH
jgi:F-box interacting protein